MTIRGFNTHKVVAVVVRSITCFGASGAQDEAIDPQRKSPDP